MSKNILNPNAKKLQLSGTYGTFGKRNEVKRNLNSMYAKHGITEEAYPAKLQLSGTYGTFGKRIDQ